MNNYTLDAIENPRLQRLKEKIAGFIFDAKWIKGKTHCIPDALSRNPVKNPTEEDKVLEEDMMFNIRNITLAAASIISPDGKIDPSIQEILRAAKGDKQYQALRQYLMNNDKRKPLQITDDILPYKRFLDALTCDDEIVLYGSRLVIPTSLRRKTLERLHASHSGTEATKRRARQSVWWPSLNNDVKTTTEACEMCQTYQPSQQQEPLLKDTQPEWPFEVVSADLFSVAGKSFIVYADRLSGWASVAKLGNDTTTGAVTAKMKQLFQRTGVPRRLRTDGGPQFASAEFNDFCSKWQIDHEFSSPHHPQANGHAEANVKKVKRLVQKCEPIGDICSDAFTQGILELRNTPNINGLSPAQILTGRILRSTVPAHRRMYAPQWNEKIREWEKKQSIRAEKAETAYNKKSKDLPELNIGDHVRIQDHESKKWTVTGVITEAKPNRSYNVQLPSGRILWRNRKFLRKIPPKVETAQNEQLQNHEPKRYNLRSKQK